MATYNNDEPIQVTNENITSGQGVAVVQSNIGAVQLKIGFEDDVTNQETKFPVLIEVTGAAHDEQRMGVDIVAVLDTSSSMNEQKKLEKMKRAMTFIVQKLSPNDRLSIVAFASKAELVCNLRQMTEDAKVQVAALVQELDTNSNTNTAEGLNMALQVLNDRRLKTGRAKAIILMSDGVQNMGLQAESIPLGDIPVYTFGFGSGQDYNPTALNTIANNSIGGTFSYAEVKDTDYSNLSIVFSQCLAGLHSIAVQELKVTISPMKFVVGGVCTESIIQKVFAGDYIKTINPDGSVTILFGDLYRQEVRKIVIELLLPAVEIKETALTSIIRIGRSFKVVDTVKKIRPTVATVTRTLTPSSKESEALKAEILRIQTLEKFNPTIDMADQMDFVEATKLLTDAQNKLEDAVFDEPNTSIDSLKQEMDKLLEYMQDADTYEKKGRPFALSSRTSPAGQRFAGRGDDVGTNKFQFQVRGNVHKFSVSTCFGFRRMGTLYVQAAAFDETNPDPELAMSVAGKGDDVGTIRPYATPRMATLYDQAVALDTNSDPELAMSVAGSGDDVGYISSHATPRMDTLSLQAEAFEQNLDLELVTSVEEGEKVETMAIK